MVSEPHKGVLLPHPPSIASCCSQHPSGPQPLIELDAIYNTKASVMEMAWKMNGPKRWDFLNFLREIILEREKEKPICSFSCMGLPPSFSCLLFCSLSHSLPCISFFVFLSLVFCSQPLVLFLSLSLPVIGFLFWRVKRHDLLYLQPQSLEPTRSTSPPPVVLIAWEKGQRGVGAQFPQRECAVGCLHDTEENFTAEHFWLRIFPYHLSIDTNTR